MTRTCTTYYSVYLADQWQLFFCSDLQCQLPLLGGCLLVLHTEVRGEGDAVLLQQCSLLLHHLQQSGSLLQELVNGDLSSGQLDRGKSCREAVLQTGRLKVTGSLQEFKELLLERKESRGAREPLEWEGRSKCKLM